MQNFNVELFSRLFFLNLAKSFKIDENFSFVTDQASVAGSNQASLEPPTPPRTPITGHHQSRSAEKHFNNNNDDAKENFEGNSSSQHLTPLKLTAKASKSESDHEEYPRRMSQYNEDSNFSEEDRGGRESALSESMRMNGEGDEESEHEESDCASSFDGSKLSLKNIEHFLDKSPMVRTQSTLTPCRWLISTEIFHRASTIRWCT